MAVEINIHHPSKHVPWGGSTGTFSFDWYGEDKSGSTFKMTFAETVGGTPVISLTAAAAGSQGVSSTYDEDAVDPNTGAVVGMTEILPQIDEGELEGLTWGSDASADLTLYYDLIEVVSGSNEKVLFNGTFAIGAGVGD